MEDAGDGSRDHELFVGRDDAYLDATGVRRNQRFILGIALEV
jgi:hypothetical protein